MPAVDVNVHQGAGRLGHVFAPRGAFPVARAAVGAMCDAGYGRMVLTSSIGGIYGTADVADYAAAAAVTRMIAPAGRLARAALVEQ